MQIEEKPDGDAAIKVDGDEVHIMLIHAAQEMGPGQFADEIFQLIKDIAFAHVIPITFTKEIPEITAKGITRRDRFPAGKRGDFAFAMSLAVSHRMNDIIQRYLATSELERAQPVGRPN